MKYLILAISVVFVFMILSFSSDDIESYNVTGLKKEYSVFGYRNSPDKFFNTRYVVETESGNLYCDSLTYSKIELKSYTMIVRKTFFKKTIIGFYK